jgi:hypothetical protein
VLPIRVSGHNPPGASAAATRVAKRGSLVGLVEDVEATAVEHELKWATRRRAGKEIQCCEPAAQRCV